MRQSRDSHSSSQTPEPYSVVITHCTLYMVLFPWWFRAFDFRLTVLVYIEISATWQALSVLFFFFHFCPAVGCKFPFSSTALSSIMNHAWFLLHRWLQSKTYLWISVRVKGIYFLLVTWLQVSFLLYEEESQAMIYWKPSLLLINQT